MEQPITPTPVMPVPPPPNETVVSYVGFWARVAAVIIDGIIIGIVSGVLAVILKLGSATEVADVKNLSNDISGLIALFYYPLMESSSHQATLGKIAMGIKVTDLTGNRITIGRAIGRYFAKILSTLILFIGFIMVAFTEKKQGLHDMIAGTLVVKK